MGIIEIVARANVYPYRTFFGFADHGFKIGAAIENYNIREQCINSKPWQDCYYHMLKFETVMVWEE